MLLIKCTPNIFLISVYVFLQQDIWYVKVGVLKNWKQLSLSVTYSVFCIYWCRSSFFICFYSSLIWSRCTDKTCTIKNFVLKKILTRKNWTHKIPTRKNFGPTKHSREKYLNPRRHSGTMARDPRGHQTHGI